MCSERADTSHTPGVLGKISALVLSLFPFHSASLSFSFTVTLPLPHIMLTSPIFIPSQQQKSEYRVYLYVLGLVIRNDRKMLFLLRCSDQVHRKAPELLMLSDGGWGTDEFAHHMVINARTYLVRLYVAQSCQIPTLALTETDQQ